MGFKEEYAKFGKPSPQREQFVLKTLLSLPREAIVRSMRPITVNRPDGTKIIYKVMPDYIMVDGMRVPMAGNTAQRVADHFGLSLPTAQQARDIHNNADVQVNAKPLSGSGTKIDGKNYSGQDVVNTGVGYAPFAVAYNDKINSQLADQGAQNGQIVSGFAKDIVQSPAEGKLGLYGFYQNGKPIQGGNGQTPHDTDIHTEYGSFVRLVSPEVTVVYPDGRKENKPAGSIYQANRYPVAPGKQSTKPINSPKDSAPQQVAQYAPDKPQSGRAQILERIDNYLSQLMGKI
jgi:hypothetical protein